MVDYELRGRVAVITLRRPEAGNTIDGPTTRAIEAGLDRIEGDEEVWAGILAAEGPVFCAGGDLRAVAAGEASALHTSRGGFAGLAGRNRTKPLLAAVEGAALGGGCEMVLACDLVVASRGASFGLPEVSRSLLPTAGGLVRLPRLVGTTVALEMIMTGQPITAERAHELGLVNRLVDSGRALDEALALAGRITANAPLAVREGRRLVLASVQDQDDRLWRLLADAIDRIGASADFAEGPRAFFEQRAPVWTGH